MKVTQRVVSVESTIVLSQAETNDLVSIIDRINSGKNLHKSQFSLREKRLMNAIKIAVTTKEA